MSFRQWVGICFGVLLVAIGFCVTPLTASATQHRLPPSVFPELLSETVPFVFAPSDIDERDFQVSWLGGPIGGIRGSLVPGSGDWVRYDTSIVLERALLKIEGQPGDSGVLEYSGGIHQWPLVEDGKASIVEIPVILSSGRQNSIRMRIKRAGKEFEGVLLLSFEPRPEIASDVHERLIRDPSCSKYGVEIEPLRLRKKMFAFVGCRFVRLPAKGGTRANLEVFVYWDGGEKTIQVNGSEVDQSSQSIWHFGLASYPGKIRLTSPQGDLVVHYRIPEEVHRGFIGVGIGPYLYSVQDSADDIHSVAPLATLYASYFIKETIRVVAFNAISGHRRFYNDFGLYLWMEQFRFLDQRLAINLLLGANFTVFPFQGSTRFRFNVPQGVEVTYTDAFVRGRNFSVGSFLYPVIEGRSYYNLWLRWGGSVFGEVNYIAWSDRIDQQDIRTSSLGFSIGFPLTGF